ncbi:MAG: thiamine phosphate synthase [Lachnospiraceae bacterium]
MSTFMFKIIAISNETLYQQYHSKNTREDYIMHLSLLGKWAKEKGIPVPELLILREKILEESDYDKLLRDVKKACENQRNQGEMRDRPQMELCAHTYLKSAEKQGIKRIHLPFTVFLENIEKVKLKKLVVGTSIHSLEEAKEAERQGASYVTAGHIFTTDCKRGVSPKGLEFLEEICEKIKIPVYAIGGIHPWNLAQIESTKAAGACMMSEYMMSEPKEQKA